MSYKIKTLPKFEKGLKRLAKKYPSIKTDYVNLLQSLKQNPIQGTSLGNECYKVRFAISSKGKGKSGGARVITCIKVVDENIFLLTIFDKSEQETISDKELFDLLKYIN